MSDRLRPPATLWLTPILTWIALIVMLGANALIAFLPLGMAKAPVNFCVSGIQVALVGLFFMRLDKASNLVRLAACAGFLWLLFLFVMAGTDYFARP